MKKTTWYEHLTPMVLAIFPILSLAIENIEFVQFGSILRSVLISIVVAYLFYLILYLILRDQRKSAILSSILIFLLLTYGNTYISLGPQLGETFLHGKLLGIYVVLFILIGTYIVKRVKNAKDLSSAIFFGGLVISLYLLISFGLYQYRVYRPGAISEYSNDLLQATIKHENISDLPDIYLILLDGHTRSDVLKNVYDLDNSEFIEKLEGLGFWVADCAESNYPTTNFSTRALFEMNYLHTLYSDFDNLVLPPLNNTPVFQILENLNYSTVTFQNFVFEHFNIKEDIRFEREGGKFGSVNEFEKMLVETSILRILIDHEGFFPETWLRPFTKDINLTLYRDSLYALETLPSLAEIDDRLFVYAQLLVTHDPYVFMPDGSFNPEGKWTAPNYKNTIEYIDNVLPEIVEELIQKSEDPPIIIIMGDHGATLKRTPIEERMSILFAIYYQGVEAAGFYEEITPVNVFRLIFNNMFEANYEMLRDISFDVWNKADLGDLHKRVYPPCTP